MKVLQVLPAMQGGGVERGTVEVATYLTQKNIENIVVSAGGRLVPELERIGVRHLTLDVGSKNPIKFFFNIRSFRRLIKQENITIVHARSRVPAWVAYFALKKCPEVHFITTFHGKYGTSPEWLKIKYNRVILCADCDFYNMGRTALPQSRVFYPYADYMLSVIKGKTLINPEKQFKEN